MKNTKTSLKILYSNKAYIALFGVIFSIVFGIYMYVMLQSASWEVIWLMNSRVYNAFQLVTSFINAVLTSIALSMFIFILRNKQKSSGFGSVQTVFAVLFSALTTGCYVCGAVLLPTVGITLSLTSLPFGGLEIKLMTILLLVYVIYEYSKSISGNCEIRQVKLFEFKQGKLRILKSKDLFFAFKPLFVLLFFLVAFVLLPKLPFKHNFINSNLTDAQASQYSCLSKTN